MSIYPPRVKKFIKMRVDPYDAIILSEIRENLKYIGGEKADLLSFNEKIEFYKKENHRQQLQYGVPLDKVQWWEDHYGPSYYKINKNGKVTLIWSGIEEFGFPYLRKIPLNLLDLPDLRYFDLMCEVREEEIPKFNNSNKFEIRIIYTDEWRANAWSEKNWREGKTIIKCNHEAFEIADKAADSIDLNNFFELRICRKDLSNQFKTKKGWEFMFEQAFKNE